MGIVAPKLENKYVEIDGKPHIVIPEILNKAIFHLMTTWRELGRPRTLFSESGEKLMKVIVAVWEDIYPKESLRWIEARSTHLSAEKTIKEQVKSQSGRTLASIPMFIHKITKVFFTEDEQDRDYYLKLSKKYPLFRWVNEV